MKDAFALVGVMIVVFCIVGVSLILGWVGGVFNRVASPDAAIGGYEWYEQQVKDIKAIEGQIKDAEDSCKQFKEDNGAAKEWTYDQRGEYSRLNSNTTGLKQAKRKMVEDYNARAAMITRNLWKRSDLPQHIEE